MDHDPDFIDHNTNFGLIPVNLSESRSTRFSQTKQNIVNDSLIKNKFLHSPT